MYKSYIYHFIRPALIKVQTDIYKNRRMFYDELQKSMEKMIANQTVKIQRCSLLYCYDVFIFSPSQDILADKRIIQTEAWNHHIRAVIIYSWWPVDFKCTFFLKKVTSTYSKCSHSPEADWWGRKGLKAKHETLVPHRSASGECETPQAPHDPKVRSDCAQKFQPGTFLRSSPTCPGPRAFDSVHKRLPRFSTFPVQPGGVGPQNWESRPHICSALFVMGPMVSAEMGL